MAKISSFSKYVIWKGYMLAAKYKPKTLEDAVGNREQTREIESWLKGWRKGEALFLYGPSGCGKSLVIELVAKKMNLELIESHANENRSYRELKDTVMKSAHQQSLLRRGKLVLIDEIDVMDSAKGITEIISSSDFPVVLIGENPYESSLSAVRKSCRLVKFGSIRYDLIAAFLKNICLAERIKFDDIAITQLARSCNGDIRAALNDLETLLKADMAHVKNLPSRAQERNIFDTLKAIFKTSSIRNAKAAVSDSDKSPEDILLWLEENIPDEYENIDEIAAAYDYLSKADLLSARRQSRYSADVGILGVAMSKKNAYKKFTRYSFPRFLKKQTSDSILDGLSKNLHVSRKKSREYLHLISLIAGSLEEGNALKSASK